uniref:Uncharacterized protein n=1 Tax=Solanum tuberosum TaxID=4113 RepID=M1D7V1_SOLTU
MPVFSSCLSIKRHKHSRHVRVERKETKRNEIRMRLLPSSGQRTENKNEQGVGELSPLKSDSEKSTNKAGMSGKRLSKIWIFSLFQTYFLSIHI